MTIEVTPPQFKLRSEECNIFSNFKEKTYTNRYLLDNDFHSSPNSENRGEECHTVVYAFYIYILFSVSFVC